MKNVKELFDTEFQKGNRFDLVLRLAGSCAVYNVPLEECIEFYNDYKDLDDEDRVSLIERTYERYYSGQKVRTLGKDISLTPPFTVDEENKDFISNDICLNMLENELSVFNYNKKTVNLDEIGVPLFKYKNVFDKAVKYLENRKITLDLVEKYKIYHGIDYYKDFIIFPVFNSKNEVIYYSMKDYVNQGKGYKFPKMSRKSIIWNYYNTVKNLPVFVCEGIINALTICKFFGINQVIATLSKYLTQEQIDMLTVYNKCIFVFDGDCSTDFLFSIFDKIGNKVEYLMLPKDKDVNDLTKEEFLKYYRFRYMYIKDSLI